jgi:hypothetical protein
MEAQLRAIMTALDMCRAMFDNINNDRRTCVGCGAPLPSGYHEHKVGCPIKRLDYICDEYRERVR